MDIFRSKVINHSILNMKKTVKVNKMSDYHKLGLFMSIVSLF